MSLIENERLKLTATGLNTLASGSIVIGVITPTAVAIYGTPGTQAPGWAIGLAGLGFLCIGVALHMLARLVLEGLRE